MSTLNCSEISHGGPKISKVIILSWFLKSAVVQRMFLPLIYRSSNINVDRSFLANGNCSGIGDAFRNYDGTIILHFYKEVFTDSTIQTDVLAILKVF